MNQITLLLTAFLLVAANGFFVAAEFALVKLRQTRVKAIEQTAGWRGRMLASVHGRLDAYLSACQVGITLASLALGWIGEPAFAGIIQPLFSYLGVEAELAHGLTVAVVFLLISYLHIVVGEMAPKSLAIRKPELVGLWTAPGMALFYLLLYPLISLLNTSAIWMLRSLGLEQAGDEHNYSADELKLILQDSDARGRFTEEEWRMVADILDFSELTVSEIMRPIGEIVGLAADQGFADNKALIAQGRFSRYPYFAAGGEEVVGVLHFKDLVVALAADQGFGEDNHWFEAHLRPAETVSPDTLALVVFRRMRQGGSHLMLVGQSGMKPIGFLTMENLLSVLLGRMRDEFRANDHEWVIQHDGTWLGKGSLTLLSLARVLGCRVEHPHADSIGGLIMETLGDLPKEGQRIDFGQFAVVVKKMQGPRIVLVRIYPQAEPEEPAS